MPRHRTVSNLSLDRTVETAFVFGAGASLPHLTGQQGLVLQLLTVSAPDRRIIPAQTYLKTVFPGSPNPTLRFEDIVGPLEISESEEYWFHFAGRSAETQRVAFTNHDVLDALDTWVAMSLDPPSLPKSKSSEESPDASSAYVNFYAPSAAAPLGYARLAHLLRVAGKLEQTAFLSMNYDVLLDRVFYASADHDPDYMIDGFHPSSGPASSKRARILKLHGSLNWRSCDRCHILRNEREFVVWPRSHCVDCGSRSARPMLIRPTLLKDFRHRVWQEVWRSAGHVLAGARRWIFIGYSLPLADVWMLRLLAQSYRSGVVVPRTREIEVVNPDIAVRDRFSLLFPNLIFRQQTFDEWLAENEPK